MRLIAFTTLIMMAFAANSLLTRAGVFGAGLNPLWFGTIRLISGAIVLVALVAWQKQIPHWRQELRPSTVFALIAYVFGFSMAYLQLDSGLGALILFGTVQITMFTGGLFAQEQPPAMRWIGSGIAFAGLIYLLGPSGSAVDIHAALLMVLAGLGWGIYSLVGRHALNATLSTAVNFALAAPLGLGLTLLFSETSFDTLPAQGIAFALVSGILTSGLGYAMWYRLLPHLDRSAASVAQLTVPVFALLGGLVFFGEAITWQVLLASCIVLVGVALSVLR